MIRCTCCNTELTAPQFYNGHPYGMTCIKRIDPAQKVVKTVYVGTNGQWSNALLQDGVLYVAESFLK